MQSPTTPESGLIQTLRDCCEEHLRVAALYERGGNCSGARQLRAVANLLGVVIQGGKPTTVLPAPTKEDMNMDERYTPEDDYDPDNDPEIEEAELRRTLLLNEVQPVDLEHDYDELGAGDA